MYPGTNGYELYKTGILKFADLNEQGKSQGSDSCDRPSNLTELDPSHWFFSPCDIDIWMDDLENRAPLLYYIKLFLCIISNPSVNSNLSYRPETLNLGQNRHFSCAVWPWNLIDDFEKQ